MDQHKILISNSIFISGKDAGIYLKQIASTGLAFNGAARRRFAVATAIGAVFAFSKFSLKFQ
jgi:hypothetical protein